MTAIRVGRAPARGTPHLGPVGSSPPKHRPLAALELVCWTIAFLLIGLYGLARIDAAVSSEAELYRFDSRAPADDLWSQGRRELYRTTPAPPAEALVGVLDIPSLDLRAPLYIDVREVHLNRGVGLIDAMAAPGQGGNVGIAGHRDGFFRALQAIEVGDRIELTTPDRIYVYRVSALAVVERTDASLLRPTDQPVITLVTCHPFYFVGPAPRRFVVRGALERIHVPGSNRS